MIQLGRLPNRPEAMLMFRRAAWAIGCFWLASAAASSTTDAAWLSHEELGRYCLSLEDASAPENGTVCLAYVQGFIAGRTVAQSQRVGPEESDTEGESFSERAIRTRAGSYLRRIEEMQTDDYCIGDDVTTNAVLDAVVEHLEATPDHSRLTARGIVHEALVEGFPCADR